MKANIYRMSKPRPMWQVVYRDPTRSEGKRRKRIRRHFINKSEAEAYLKTINEHLDLEGAAGVTFDAILRTDACAARQRLDTAGRPQVTLLQLADAFLASNHSHEAHPAGEALDDFLHEKEAIEGCAQRTISNLRNRIRQFLHTTGIRTVDEITREQVEALRLRAGVSAQSRRNDMAALSSFCTWLLDKRYLDHHPLKGLRRPKLPPANKATFSAEQCAAVLRAAQDYLDGRWLGTVAVLLWTGCRPSELAQTRLIYEAPAVARIEGGKLKGRANRTVPLSPAAQAWLAAAGNPETVLPLHTRARRTIATLASVPWRQDITRHTYISHRLALVKNDAEVAREAGTSQEMIHRHYHSLKLEREALAWAAIRPK